VKQVHAWESGTFLLREDGSLWSSGAQNGGTVGRTGPLLRFDFVIGNVSTLACGAGHVVAISTSGIIYVWGQNDYGQLGIGSTTPTQVDFPQISTTIPSNATFLALGEATSLIATNKTLWSFGENSFGQLGQGDTIDRNLPTQVSMDFGAIWKIYSGGQTSFLLNEQGILWCWGSNNYHQLGPGIIPPIVTTPTLSNMIGVIQIAAASNNNLFLTNSSEIYCVGSNQYVLGIGDKPTNRISVQNPIYVSIATDHSIIMNSCPNSSYTGLQCDRSMCNRFPSGSNEVCSGAGQCVSPEVCVCDPPALGPNCEFKEYHWIGVSGVW
jgi:alpha-tubulin suppressor-like RCC1 family protein